VFHWASLTEQLLPDGEADFGVRKSCQQSVVGLFFRCDTLFLQIIQHLVGQSRGEREFGGPTDQRIARSSQKSIVGTQQVSLARLGPVGEKAGPLRLSQIDPGK